MALAISDIERECPLLSDDPKMEKYDYNKYKELVLCFENILIQEEDDIYTIIEIILIHELSLKLRKYNAL